MYIIRCNYQSSFYWSLIGLPFLASLLIACAATRPALSENWTQVAENYIAVFYINDDSLVIYGNRRRVWEIQDLKARDPDGELSRLAQTEYDCKGRRVRVLAYIEHADKMAQGAILSSTKPLIRQWSVIPAGTPTYRVLNKVCAA